MTHEQAKGMVGTYITPSEYPEKDWGALLENFQAPESFDFRIQWPDCVSNIRDQGLCGGCWAFGAAEALSDRFCIKGQKVVLSPQFLLSCNVSNYGCNGGYTDEAWSFLRYYGVSSDECVSYTSGNGDNGECPKFCEDGSPIKLYRAASIDSICSQTHIQAELMLNGPIEVSITVYEDFMSYSSGIYKHTSGEKVGGHSVKLLGWGLENGIKYWICANSWNTEWGEAGYFRIAWGEVGIEKNGIAGVPDL